MLRRLGAAGAAGATASLVTTADAFAAMGSCCTSASSYALIGSCQAQVTVPNGCTTTFSNSITVCRTLPTTTMMLARNSNGTQRPYFDELAWIQVTSPLGTSRSRNFNGWQVNCAPAATFSTLSGFNTGTPCGAGAGSPVDISNLFGTTECGLFSVDILVRNGTTPKGHSTAYIVPA